MDLKSKPIILVSIIIAVIIAAVGFWYWFFKAEPADKTEPTEPVQTEEALEILSETPLIQIETNPIKKVPDINPVEKINPFKTTNPFE